MAKLKPTSKAFVAGIVVAVVVIAGLSLYLSLDARLTRIEYFLSAISQARG